MFFVDDSILFAKAYRSESERVQHELKIYMENSGKRINLGKSTLFFNHNTRNELKCMIKNLFGVQSTENLGKYLGISSLIGKDRKRTFKELKDIMIARVKN